MKAVLDYLYRKDKPKKKAQEDQNGVPLSNEEKENKMLLEEDLFAEKKNERKLKIRRPIIFICNNQYAKGLKMLREQSIVFNFQRNTQAVVERLKDICPEEKIVANQECLTQMVSMFDGDMRSCLNFLDMFCTNKNITPLGTYNLDLYNLKPIQLSHQNYFDLFNFVFSKRVASKRYTTRSSLFNYILQFASKSLDKNTLLNGIFVNYLETPNLKANFGLLGRFVESLSDAAV